MVATAAWVAMAQMDAAAIQVILDPMDAIATTLALAVVREPPVLAPMESGVTTTAPVDPVAEAVGEVMQVPVNAASMAALQVLVTPAAVPAPAPAAGVVTRAGVGSVASLAALHRAAVTAGRVHQVRTVQTAITGVAALILGVSHRPSVASYTDPLVE